VHVGNEKIYRLTAAKRQVLRIELEDSESHKAYAEYDNFKLGSEKNLYKLLELGKYSGNAG